MRWFFFYKRREDKSEAPSLFSERSKKDYIGFVVVEVFLVSIVLFEIIPTKFFDHKKLLKLAFQREYRVILEFRIR